MRLDAILIEELLTPVARNYGDRPEISEAARVRARELLARSAALAARFGMRLSHQPHAKEPADEDA